MEPVAYGDRMSAHSGQRWNLALEEGEHPPPLLLVRSAAYQPPFPPPTANTGKAETSTVMAATYMATAIFLAFCMGSSLD